MNKLLLILLLVSYEVDLSHAFGMFSRCTGTATHPNDESEHFDDEETAGMPPTSTESTPEADKRCNFAGRYTEKYYYNERYGKMAKNELFRSGVRYVDYDAGKIVFHQTVPAERFIFFDKGLQMKYNYTKGGGECIKTPLSDWEMGAYFIESIPSDAQWTVTLHGNHWRFSRSERSCSLRAEAKVSSCVLSSMGFYLMTDGCNTSYNAMFNHFNDHTIEETLDFNQFTSNRCFKADAAYMPPNSAETTREAEKRCNFAGKYTEEYHGYERYGSDTYLFRSGVRYVDYYAGKIVYHQKEPAERFIFFDKGLQMKYNYTKDGGECIKTPHPDWEMGAHFIESIPSDAYWNLIEWRFHVFIGSCYVEAVVHVSSCVLIDALFSVHDCNEPYELTWNKFYNHTIVETIDFNQFTSSSCFEADAE